MWSSLAKEPTPSMVLPWVVLAGVGPGDLMFAENKGYLSYEWFSQTQPGGIQASAVEG